MRRLLLLSNFDNEAPDLIYFPKGKFITLNKAEQTEKLLLLLETLIIELQDMPFERLQI